MIIVNLDVMLAKRKMSLTELSEAVVVDGDVVGLGVGAKLACLQIAPLVADGAQGSLLSVEAHLDGFCQRRLVIYIERDEHVLVVEHICHGGVGPYGSLHLAAVDAAEAGKVDEHRLALCLGSRHSLFIGVVMGFYGLGVEVEVLGVDGGGLSCFASSR